MATRLWFLIQLVPRFAANIPLTNSVNLPLLPHCIPSYRLLCSKQKPDVVKSDPAASNSNTLNDKDGENGLERWSNRKSE